MFRRQKKLFWVRLCARTFVPRSRGRRLVPSEMFCRVMCCAAKCANAMLTQRNMVTVADRHRSSSSSISSNTLAISFACVSLPAMSVIFRRRWSFIGLLMPLNEACRQRLQLPLSHPCCRPFHLFRSENFKVQRP